MKTSEELLSSILKTAQMGQVGIRAIMHADLNDELKNALQNQLGEYDRIESRAKNLATTEKLNPKELNQMSKTMAKSTTKARLSYGNKSSKAAAMMIQGNTRGIVKSLKNLNHYNHSNPRIEALAKDLLNCEENNAQQMQRFV